MYNQSVDMFYLPETDFRHLFDSHFDSPKNDSIKQDSQTSRVTAALTTVREAITTTAQRVASALREFSKDFCAGVRSFGPDCKELGKDFVAGVQGLKESCAEKVEALRGTHLSSQSKTQRPPSAPNLGWNDHPRLRETYPSWSTEEEKPTEKPAPRSPADIKKYTDPMFEKYRPAEDLTATEIDNESLFDGLQDPENQTESSESESISTLREIAEDERVDDTTLASLRKTPPLAERIGTRLERLGDAIGRPFNWLHDKLNEIFFGGIPE